MKDTKCNTIAKKKSIELYHFYSERHIWENY